MRAILMIGLAAMAVLFIAARGSGPVELEFNTVTQGIHSGIVSKEPTAFKITAEKRWLRLWERHQAATLLPMPVPEIDFPKQIVIAVFDQQRSTSGYEIYITKVERQGRNIEVTAVAVGPGLGCGTWPVMTEPYHMVQLPRTKGKIELTMLHAVKLPCGGW